MKFLIKLYRKLNTVSKVLLSLIFILMFIQLYQTYQDFIKIGKFIPIDLKVESARFEYGYPLRHFYDTYIDITLDRKLSDQDMDLLGIIIEGEEIDISRSGDRVLRVTFKSEFTPNQERHLKVSYGGNVFFETYYKNHNLTEKESLENLPRSLNVIE